MKIISPEITHKSVMALSQISRGKIRVKTAYNEIMGAIAKMAAKVIIDINPLIVHKNGAVSVDARIVLEDK